MTEAGRRECYDTEVSWAGRGPPHAFVETVSQRGRGPQGNAYRRFMIGFRLCGMTFSMTSGVPCTGLISSEKVL